MLSSIYKFLDAAMGLRQDTCEGVAAYSSSSFRIVGDVTDRYLVLCTSVSFHKSSRCDKRSGVLIIDLNRFIIEIKEALLNIGYGVDGIFVGPCNYCGRDMSFKQVGESQNLTEMICFEDLFFCKDLNYSFENEYRIVFKLDKILNKKSVIVNLNIGAIKQYARPYVFKD